MSANVRFRFLRTIAARDESPFTVAELALPLEERHARRESGLHKEARAGFVYRGMTHEEWHDHWRKGGILSVGRYSHPSEGTCFADGPEDAEAYVDFGRDDPRRTGRANYLVEVPLTSAFRRNRDGYPKTRDRIPLAAISRLWRLRAAGPDLILADEYLASVR
jgi:hypothetical protein